MREPENERPIPELDALRAPARTDAQRRRLRARIAAAAGPLLAQRRHPTGWLEVLGGWARPGLVAAAVALALLFGALRLGVGRAPVAEPARLDEVLTANGAGGGVPALLVATSEPDADAVVEMALLERGHGADLPDPRR